MYAVSVQLDGFLQRGNFPRPDQGTESDGRASSLFVTLCRSSPYVK